MKKITALTLVLVLILTAALPVFGAEGDSESLAEAITAVKKVVDIPESYSEFYSNQYSYEDGEGGVWQVWGLEWYDSAADGYISAEVESGGGLLSYYNYKWNQDDKGLAKVYRSQARDIAGAFLEKALPEIAGSMVLVNEAQNAANTYTHNFSYRMYAGSGPVAFITASVSVDRYTGEVSSYDSPGIGWILPELAGAENSLGMPAATEAYLKEVGVELTYRSYFDYETKELTVFPVYGLKSNGYISAATGELVEPYYRGGGLRTSYGAADEAPAEVGDGGANKAFSPAELEEMAQVAGLLSQGEAVKKIAAQVPGISASDKVETATLSQDWMDPEKYIWNIRFTSDGFVSAGVDARSGELLSFSLTKEGSKEGNKNLSKEQAIEVAEDFLVSVVPEKYGTCLYDERFSIYSAISRNTESDNYRFAFVRQAEGLPFVDNRLFVSVNAGTGKVYAFSGDWYDKAEFPPVEDPLTEEEIFETIAASGDFGPLFILTGKDEAALVYGFVEDISYQTFDPYTAQRLNNDGSVYTDTALPVYGDLSGHWCEALVAELMENGYYLAGDSFLPDQAVTQMEFLMYLTGTAKRNYSEEEFYEYLFRNGILTEEEKDPAKPLQRQEAAKYIIRLLGLDKAAVHPEIYQHLFKDTVAPEYIGYASISQALGIIQGAGDGKFNGTGIMTRSQAAAAVYKTLKVE